MISTNRLSNQKQKDELGLVFVADKQDTMVFKADRQVNLKARPAGCIASPRSCDMSS
jgi:hypothetical protein